jgi:two-component system phosphate regulon sensor histidine kinase PhoR
VTSRFVWLTVCLVAGTALAMLVVGLAFLPISVWETYVPAATLVGGAAVVLAAAVIELVGRRMARPLRQMVRRIDAGEVGPATLREFAYQAPEEVAPLLYALHRAQAGLRRVLEQLERDRGQMAALFEHLTDGVLVLDPDERIVLGNPAASRLLGQPLVGSRRLVEAVRDAEIIELVRAARAARPAVRLIEIRDGGLFGRRVWLQVVATQLPDQERTLVVLQDVSELRRGETARREFVANVSHELRTPVAALKALVETLEGGALEDDPEVARDFLRRMHVEVDGLAHLVTELLDLARAEAGRLTLELEDCLAEDLVCQAVERMRPAAHRGGLMVQVDRESAEVPVRADARRIGQVLANLLANAVKFTPTGGEITVGARAIDGAVEFWVSDTGVGIHPDYVTRVFERFYKTDPSRTGSGTGLGLAICKHLVLAHQGAIWAESAGEGQGATFRFTLPCAVLRK